jgi:hypothetical protein
MTGARSGVATQTTTAIKLPPTAAPGFSHPDVVVSFAARGTAAASSAGGGAAPNGEGEVPVRRSTRSGAVYAQSSCTAAASNAGSAAAPAKREAPSDAAKKRKRRKGGGARKPKPRTRPTASAPARPVPDPPSKAICSRVSRIVRKVSSNMSGNVIGVDGSINATYTSCILRSLRAKGRNFLDLGCGFGWMLAAALAMGALRAVGVEFPENKPQKRIFKSVMKVVQQQKVGFTAEQPEHEFVLCDINKVNAVSCCFFSSSFNFTSLFVVVYLAVACPARWFPLRVCVLGWNGSEDSAQDTGSLRQLPDTGHSRRLSRSQELEGLQSRCSFSKYVLFLLVGSLLMNGLQSRNTSMKSLAVGDSWSATRPLCTHQASSTRSGSFPVISDTYWQAVELHVWKILVHKEFEARKLFEPVVVDARSYDSTWTSLQLHRWVWSR